MILFLKSRQIKELRQRGLMLHGTCGYVQSMSYALGIAQKHKERIGFLM